MIYIGLPVYGGAHGLALRSLLSTQKYLIEQGHDVVFDIVANSSHLPRVRNGMVGRFLKSEADVLLFLDSDMMWEPKDILKLIDAPFDVSVINYRKKLAATEWVNDPIREDGIPLGLKHEGDYWIETKRAGTGLMAIKRKTFDAMVSRFPELKYRDGTPAFFDYMLEDGDHPTEDYVFCDRVVNTGGHIFMLADAMVAHIGDTLYAGNYHEYLEGKANATS